MSNVISMPDQNKHHVEASTWVSRIDAGLTQEEEHEFAAWLATDEQNLEAFKYLAHLWDDMDDLARLAEIFPDEPQQEQARSGLRWSLAASVMVALLSVTFFIGRGTLLPSRVANSYETSVGEHSTVSLPDGSQLILNTNSLVNVSYSENYRLLTLERGEIHVDVKHDAARPLSVKAGDKVVQAVGTAFNVELLGGEVFELIVTDGKVRIGDRDWFEEKMAKKSNPRQSLKRLDVVASSVHLPEDSLAISKGERLVLNERIELLTSPEHVDLERIAEDEIEAVLSWRDGNIAFDGETLEDAMSEIGRYTSAAFEFNDDELKKLRIAGLFKAGDINGLLIALEDAFEIRSQKIGEETYRLYR